MDLVHNYHAMLMTEEIPRNCKFAVRPKPDSSGLKCRQMWTLKISIQALSAPKSANNVFIFKLKSRIISSIIED